MSMTYAQAAELYSDRADRSRTTVDGVRAVRLPGTATTLRPVAYGVRQGYGRIPRPLAYAIRYHDTDVVTLHADGRVELDTGGWLSMTTVGRMDTYTPEHIRAYGRDILARRSDAHPRVIVYRYAPAPHYVHGEIIATLDAATPSVVLHEGHRNLYRAAGDGIASEPGTDLAACGTCARVWDFEALPTPSGLCPFCNGAADPIPA